MNHNGIPSYMLKGYKVVLISENSGQVLCEKTIPDIIPGTSFNVVFNSFHEREFRIRFISPNGFVILEKDYTQRYYYLK